MTDALSLRGDRKSEVATQRRRRDDTTIDGGQRLRLAIPPAVQERLKSEGLTPRWANDVGNRIEQLTKHDDYDRVDGVEPVTVVIDATKGTTAQAILLAKPTAFLAEDREKRDVKRREVERAMVDATAVARDGRYLVEGSTIDTGARRPSP